jgi:poly(hydroxyalkanoate) depolymerase family esterase
VHSDEALTHNGGGDPTGIVSMVKYVVQNLNGDPERVYVTGHSSGGMMTNVMLGSYPDVFKAGSAYAGVPFGCFAGNNSWNSDCAAGNITKSGSEWGDMVRSACPGYAGPRPRMQLWHGTEDDTLVFHNFAEEIKEWTNVLGVSETPTTTENDTPRATWIRTGFADETGQVLVEAIQEQGQPHNLQILPEETIRFFGLDK